MATLVVFFLLQLSDAATTMIFLGRGVTEGNPVIAALLGLSTHPVVALGLAKAAACTLAFAAWKGRRTKLLRRANIFFTLCVAWNLAAIATVVG
jgi:hypothetical protein